jgi:hypothetical protein
MSSGRAPFRKSDVARAIAAAKQAGVDIARIEIDKEGKIVVVTTSGTTPGDEVDREISAFRAQQHGKNRR